MKFPGASLKSPVGLLIWAALLLAGFAAVHVAGWREHTSFLSLTFRGDLEPAAVARRGTIYLILYFCAVLVAPILTMAAGLLAAWISVDRRRPGRSRV